MASSGVQVSTTGIVIASTGTVVTATTNGDTCCCGDGHVCYECGDCCFSDASTVDVTWDLSTVTSSLGDAVVGSRTGSETGIPWVTAQLSAGHFNWYKPAYLTTPGEVAVFQGCVSGHASEWLAATDVTKTGTDHFDIEIAKSGGLGFEDPITTGDCCGFNGTAAIRITHKRADNSLIGQATGTGTVTITVNNNLCCRVSAGVCDTVSGNCDGTCPASP